LTNAPIAAAITSTGTCKFAIFEVSTLDSQALQVEDGVACRYFSADADRYDAGFGAPVAVAGRQAVPGSTTPRLRSVMAGSA
jgi:hypothetical protein